MRVLGAETISHAKSGHTGMVLSAAPLMYSIYTNMKFDPRDGEWFNRDRFVMSAGHGSGLLYATLWSFGVNMDLKTFRKYGSDLKGHPEVNSRLCIDCTTGPLGQGIATAVGIALAEKKLAHRFNRPEHDIIDHHTFCLVGDGCLMEGVSYEACNLAALWKLNKLIVLYDCNNVTLDGTRAMADGEDTAKRFRSMGWNVVIVPDGGDEYTITKKIKTAMKQTEKPTIIIAHTQIGFGTKYEGSNKAHGSVLSMEEIAKMRNDWGILTPAFEVDEDVLEHFKKLVSQKKSKHRKWKKALSEYAREYPDLYEQLLEFIERPHKDLTCEAPKKSLSGRDAGHVMLNQIDAQTPRLIGGNADVASSTKAYVADGTGAIDIFSHDNLGAKNIAYGVREFAMGTISNGLALHGYLPYCSCFLAFSDYMRPAIRMSAMMNLPVTYIFTHDGVGSPQDGKTHMANEHIAGLRIIPNITVYRPCDVAETAAVFEYAFENEKPSAIILSRGNLPACIPSTKKNVERPQAVIMATGSEVQICVKAQTLLGAIGVFVNVKSIPSMAPHVLGADMVEIQNLGVPILGVELGRGYSFLALFGKFGLKGDVVAFDTFGLSGSDEDVMQGIGFTPEKIADKVLELLQITKI